MHAQSSLKGSRVFVFVPASAAAAPACTTVFFPVHSGAHAAHATCAILLPRASIAVQLSRREPRYMPMPKPIHTTTHYHYPLPTTHRPSTLLPYPASPHGYRNRAPLPQTAYRIPHTAYRAYSVEEGPTWCGRSAACQGRGHSCWL